MKRSVGAAIVCALALCAGVLAGCASSSTPARFHTLLPAPGAVPAARTQTVPALRVEVLAVTLPVQVDVAQIVVRLPDDSMRALEHERWIAPLADEIRGALALRIDAQLTAAPAAAGASQTWRVTLEVQRFDSVLGGSAGLQAVWSLQRPDGTTLQRCQVNDRVAVRDGPVALVAGHRVLLERLGDAIARALPAAAAGTTPACA